MEPAEIARRAQRLRITQVELAKRANVHKLTVSRLFSGDRGCWSTTYNHVQRALVEEELALRDHLIALHGLPQQVRP